MRNILASELPDWALPVIVLGAVVLLAVLLIVFMAARSSRKKRAKTDRAGATRREIKKLHTTAIGESKETIERNARAAKALAEIYGDRMSEDLRKEILYVANELRFVSPRESAQTEKCDRKISNILDDCKVALSKKRPDEEEVRAAIREVRTLMIERDAER